MNTKENTIFSLNKRLLFTLCFLFYFLKGYTQSCNCPDNDDCKHCAGGITTLVLKYSGNSAALVKITDGSEVLFSQNVSPGETFTIEGAHLSGRFNGNEVLLRVDGDINTVIKVTCSLQFNPQQRLGSFYLLRAKSNGGGVLCCTSQSPDISPVITGCPANREVISTTCSVSLSWVPPQATDCNLQSFTSNFSPGASFPTGTTTVIYTAKDDNNHTSTCSFNVVVKDQNAPTVSNCPASIAVNANASCKGIATWTEPSFSDNCASNVIVTKSHAPGSTFNLGTTQVTYTGQDNSGNITTCKFNVVVTDQTPPILINCPENITINAGDDCTASPSWTPPTFSDNCSSVTLTSTHNSGSDFSLGTTEVTYTGTDDAGNKTFCKFNVIVKDQTPPRVTNCPGTITLDAGSNCKAKPSWTAPTFSDNCSSVIVTSSHKPGSDFSLGTTEVIYTGTDNAGNKTLCKFNVVVKDQTAPLVTNCPATVSISIGAECQANASWIAPTFADNCSSVTIVSSHTPGSDFPIGSTEVIYTGTDNAGNKTLCKFNVVVKDQTSPIVTGCPGTVIVNAGGDCQAKASWTAPSFTDNCGSVLITNSHTPESDFPVGVTEVTYTAKDQADNITICKFDVVVEDKLAPVIMGCPGDIYLTTSSQSGHEIVDWDEITIDDCNLLHLTSSHESGELFPIGTTQVSYIAKDKGANVSTCTFNIIVTPEIVGLDIGKVITPDGNGVNDEWVIGNIEKYESNKVVVVDRWGSVIYNVTGYNNSSQVWGGRNTSGTLVPTGTYFYTISIRAGSTITEKKGFVEIIR